MYIYQIRTEIQIAPRKEMKSFKQTQKTLTKFKMKLDDIEAFPELVSTPLKTESDINNELDAMTKNKCNLNFLDVSQRTTTDIKDDKSFKPGWVVLSFDDENNTVVQKINDNSSDPLDEDEFYILQNEMKSVISSMIYTWDKYRKHYEELNGEDAYQYNYFSLNCLDEAEYEEDE